MSDERPRRPYEDDLPRFDLRLPQPSAFLGLAEEEFDAEAYERREAEQRQEAADTLRALLVEQGVSSEALDEVLPALLRLAEPRIDRGSGVLSGGLLVHVPPYDPRGGETGRYWALNLRSAWREEPDE